MTRRNRVSRVLAVTLLAVLAAGPVAACSSEGADVDCSLNSCTVTLDRGVDAKASVLGIDVSLVEVENNQVIVDVGGNEVTVPVGDQSQVNSGGLSISVQKVTNDQVVLQISKGQ